MVRGIQLIKNQHRVQQSDLLGPFLLAQEELSMKIHVSSFHHLFFFPSSVRSGHFLLLLFVSGTQCISTVLWSNTAWCMLKYRSQSWCHFRCARYLHEGRQSDSFAWFRKAFAYSVVLLSTRFLQSNVSTKVVSRAVQPATTFLQRLRNSHPRTPRQPPDMRVHAGPRQSFDQLGRPL